MNKNKYETKAVSANAGVPELAGDERPGGVQQPQFGVRGHVATGGRPDDREHQLSAEGGGSSEVLGQGDGQDHRGQLPAHCAFQGGQGFVDW